MGLSKTKNGAFLAAIFFCCTAFVCAGQLSVDGGEKSIFSNSDSLSGSQLNSEDIGDDFKDTLRSMMIAVSIVVILGVAAIYASKKILPKLSHAQGKKIKVVETIHLGSRKTVHLLEIGGQQILIGSTSDRITKLADIFSEKGFPLDHKENSGGTE